MFKCFKNQNLKQLDVEVEVEVEVVVEVEDICKMCVLMRMQRESNNFHRSVSVKKLVSLNC